MADQGDLFSANASWFHVFKAMIESGDAAKMGGTVFLVYCVIKSHCAFGDGGAFPSTDLIAEKAGIGTRQVLRALETLEEYGYLTRHKEWRHNRYTLREKVPIHDNATGQVTNMASWDYVPNLVGATMVDLKNVLVTGNFGDAKIVHIENLHVEIKQLIAGENNTGIQINEADLASLPADMREGLLKRVREPRGPSR